MYLILKAYHFHLIFLLDFGEFVRVIEIQTAHSRHISNEDEMRKFRENVFGGGIDMETIVVYCERNIFLYLQDLLRDYQERILPDVNPKIWR